jgi:hypothetical protein
MMLSPNHRDAIKKEIATKKPALDALRGVDQTPDVDTDNCLMQPIENWDKSDRTWYEGKHTPALIPTKRYKERYDLIDWNA